MVTILRPFGEIVIKPFEVKHTSSEMNALISRIKNIQGESRMVMEATGHYYELLPMHSLKRGSTSLLSILS